MNKIIYHFNDGSRLSSWSDASFNINEEISAYSTAFIVISRNINTFTGGYDYLLKETHPIT